MDDSASVAGRCLRKISKALGLIAPTCAFYNSGGIDTHFLNQPDSPKHRSVTSPAAAIEIFRGVSSRGATLTGQKPHKVLATYLEKCEKHLDLAKFMNSIAITDGVPTDDVESSLMAAARKLDKLDALA